MDQFNKSMGATILDKVPELAPGGLDQCPPTCWLNKGCQRRQWQCMCLENIGFKDREIDVQCGIVSSAKNQTAKNEQVLHS
jgi:hypothetical protein